MGDGEGRESVLVWAEIAAIATGLDANRRRSTGALAGRALRFTDGASRTTMVEFASANELVCAGTREAYDAVEAAPDLFLIGYRHRREPRRASFWVVDLDDGRATRVMATMPTPDAAATSFATRLHDGRDLSPVTTVVDHWSSAAADPPPHPRTDALVGKRVRYAYGAGGVYEHVYLNENLFTWHCLAGPERGLADTDLCAAYRIRRDMVLFCWREKIIPTLGIVLIDIARLESNGFLMGIDTRSAAVSFIPVGAKGELLNVTEPFE